MTNPMLLLLLQVLCCAFMAGLIWTIQLLHYPAFSFVAEDRFQKFHVFHSRQISWIVLPVMSFELLTALALLLAQPASVLFTGNLVLLTLIWLSTFFVSVPLHGSLSARMDESVIRRLVATNWIRTLLWTARLALLVFAMFSALEL